MSHKVEIQNLFDASNVADPKIREVRNNFQYVISLLDGLHSYINSACCHCADDNDTIIKRSLFEGKIQKINDALTAAKASAAETDYLSLSTYWDPSIADTSGLTNPEPETPGAEDPAAADGGGEEVVVDESADPSAP